MKSPICATTWARMSISWPRVWGWTSGSVRSFSTRVLGTAGPAFRRTRVHLLPWVHIVEAAIGVNRTQRQLVIEKLTEALGGLEGRQIAVLGLAFKPNTDDVRESPALY